MCINTHGAYILLLCFRLECLIINQSCYTSGLLRKSSRCFQGRLRFCKSVEYWHVAQQVICAEAYAQLSVIITLGYTQTNCKVDNTVTSLMRLMLKERALYWLPMIKG